MQTQIVDSMQNPKRTGGVPWDCPYLSYHYIKAIADPQFCQRLTQGLLCEVWDIQPFCGNHLS